MVLSETTGIKSMQMMHVLHKLTLNKQDGQRGERCALVQRNCILFYLTFYLTYLIYM